MPTVDLDALENAMLFVGDPHGAEAWVSRAKTDCDQLNVPRYRGLLPAANR
jgi:hypothetical protein